jgi:hypothetical protein
MDRSRSGLPQRTLLTNSCRTLPRVRHSSLGAAYAPSGTNCVSAPVLKITQARFQGSSFTNRHL